MTGRRTLAGVLLADTVRRVWAEQWTRQATRRIADALESAGIVDGIPCECGHAAGEHARMRGRCTGTDSYGLPCTCPSLDRVSEDGDAPVDDLAVAEAARYRAGLERRAAWSPDD